MSNDAIKNDPCVQKPLVSIVMAAYNAGRFIGEAIESVLNQSYPHWELLIIDDDSKDNTGDIIRQYSDPRIVYRKMPRIGHPAGVRNIGLKLSTGDFIGFLDADDVYFPDSLKKLMTPLLNNPRYTSVFGFSKRIDQHGNPMPTVFKLIPKPDGSYDYPNGYRHCWENLLNGQSTFTPCALMLRRSTLEHIGYFNESLPAAEDYEYYIRLYLDDFDGVLCLPDYVYTYRQVPASLTKDPSRFQKVSEATLSILAWQFAHPQMPAYVQQYKSQAYTYRYLHLAREHLIAGHPALTRQIVEEALGEPNIKFHHWLKRMLQLYIRSFIPARLNEFLINLRRNLRNSRAIQQERKLQHN